MKPNSLPSLLQGFKGQCTLQAEKDQRGLMSYIGLGNIAYDRISQELAFTQ